MSSARLVMVAGHGLVGVVFGFEVGYAVRDGEVFSKAPFVPGAKAGRDSSCEMFVNVCGCKVR